MPCPAQHWLLVLGLPVWLLAISGVEMTTQAQNVRTSVYSIRNYVLHGNTVLDDETIAATVAPATGSAVPLGRVCRAVAALRQAYLARGCPGVRIALPEQSLADGIVIVEVTEGVRMPESGLAKPGATAPMTFAVRHIVVHGNTLLGSDEIARVLRPAIGPAVSLEAIRRAATELRHAYHEQGFVTVAVSLPPQRLTNATVRMVVTEGHLAGVQVTGNQYFSDENILRNFPAIQTNTPLDGRAFQRELDVANQNRDRQIFPTLGPGPDPGTSELTLRVQDRLPWHTHLEVDNDNTPGTPDWRVNFGSEYDNVWQRDQQAGVAYAFTPQAFKTAGGSPDFGFNQPLVSSGSGFYRIPFAAGVGEDPAPPAAGRFGYQESTHEFLLPPEPAAAELDFYASASASDTGVKWGKPQTVSDSSLLTVVSQDSEQSTTANANLGTLFRFPLAEGERFRLKGFFGVDFKQARTTAFSANNFFTTTVATNQYGAETNLNWYSKGQPSEGLHVVYWPVKAGVELTEADSGGTAAASLALAGNVIGRNADFSQMASSSQARASYGKATLTASREQHLPASCSLWLRVSGQGATGPLIGNEQFAVGGEDSVRGYYEGDQYGDCGWTGTVEWRSPNFSAPVAAWSGPVPAWLRACLFCDGGEKLLLAPSAGSDSAEWLLGVGGGLAANVNNRLDARLTVALPLEPTPNTRRYDWRVNFSLGGQF